MGGGGGQISGPTTKKTFFMYVFPYSVVAIVQLLPCVGLKKENIFSITGVQLSGKTYWLLSHCKIYICGDKTWANERAGRALPTLKRLGMH